MKKFFTIALASCALLLTTSCAKKVSMSTYSDAKRYLEAWMSIHYAGVTPNEDGIYIIDEIEGSGPVIDDSLYVFASYVTAEIPSLKIVESTDAETAQQLGTYVSTNYYGDKVMYKGEQKLAYGIEAALKGMRPGGERTVVIPRWLNTSKRHDKLEDYLDSKDGGSTDFLYHIKVTDAVDSLMKWQNDSIDRYIAKNYKKEDIKKSSYGFRYIQLQEPDDTTKFSSDTTIYINYTGRLLNGQVFDTTIADTAKVHNIYNASKTYAPVKVTWANEPENLKLSGSTVIAGFYNTMWNMRHHEKCVGVFNSNLGYSTSGQGNSIPGYAPLLFEIEQVDKPDE